MIQNSVKPDVMVEVSQIPLPPGVRMRANALIIYAWLRRNLFVAR